MMVVNFEASTRGRKDPGGPSPVDMNDVRSKFPPHMAGLGTVRDKHKTPINTWEYKGYFEKPWPGYHKGPQVSQTGWVVLNDIRQNHTPAYWDKGQRRRFRMMAKSARRNARMMKLMNRRA